MCCFSFSFSRRSKIEAVSAWQIAPSIESVPLPVKAGRTCVRKVGGGVALAWFFVNMKLAREDCYQVLGVNPDADEGTIRYDILTCLSRSIVALASHTCTSTQVHVTSDPPASCSLIGKCKNADIRIYLSTICNAKPCTRSSPSNGTLIIDSSG